MTRNKNEIAIPVAIKRVECLNNKYLVVLDQSIVDYLHIDKDDDLWVLQTPSNDGIYLKMRRNPRDGN